LGKEGIDLYVYSNIALDDCVHDCDESELLQPKRAGLFFNWALLDLTTLDLTKSVHTLGLTLTDTKYLSHCTTRQLVDDVYARSRQ